MEILTSIFYSLLVVWYILSVILILYLYKNNYAPYPKKLKEPYYKEIPSDLNPGELSVLMYRKIEPQVFTAVLLSLIKKGVLKLQLQDEEYHITIANVSGRLQLERSEKVIIEFLKNINETDQFTLTEFSHYCGTKKGDTDFLFQYDLWKKVLRRESSQKQFFEQKKGYIAVKAVRNFGILLLVANFVGKYHLFTGYGVILPILFLPFFFKVTYRRNETYSEEYEKWVAFKEYIKHLKDFEEPEDLNSYTISAIVLKQMDSLYQYKKEDKNFLFAYQLNQAVLKCYRHAYLNGNRSIASVWGFK